MTITLEIEDSVKEQVLWMLKHFEGEVKIHTDEPIPTASVKESQEIRELLDSLTSDDTEIDETASVEISL